MIKCGFNQNSKLIESTEETMLEEFRKGLPSGLGNVILSREKIEAVCRRLVHEAKLSKEDAEKLADDLYEAGRRQWSDIETTAGRKGRLLELHLGQGAAEYTWLVALFVDPQRICTVEAGGPAKQLDEDMDKILGAIRTLR